TGSADRPSSSTTARARAMASRAPGSRSTASRARATRTTSSIVRGVPETTTVTPALLSAEGRHDRRRVHGRRAARVDLHAGVDVEVEVHGARLPGAAHVPDDLARADLAGVAVAVEVGVEVPVAVVAVEPDLVAAEAAVGVANRAGDDGHDLLVEMAHHVHP